MKMIGVEVHVINIKVDKLSMAKRFDPYGYSRPKVG